MKTLLKKQRMCFAFKKIGGEMGWARWLTPVVPPLGRPRQANHLRSGVQDQPGQHGETLSLLKI